MKHIVVGISSGIAAYKTLDLVKVLQAEGHEVKIIMTHSALQMISVDEVKTKTGLTPITELYPADFSYPEILKKKRVEHIDIATEADLFVISPATANLVAKMAHGIADDFLTTTLLATNAPVLVCPSMNTTMWFHPTVQQNLKTLESYGYMIMQPTSGDLACGTSGIGRLPEPEDIFTEVQHALDIQETMKDKTVLVTAGGTVEPIDNVRSISNRSSGKMGLAIAEVAYRQGAKVILIHAQDVVATYLPIKQYSFQTAQELYDLMEQYVPQVDIIFHTAAVADFTVDKQNRKIESDQELTLELKPTAKIINQIKKWNLEAMLIGFKAVDGITEGNLEKAKDKMKTANADLMVINDISRTDIGFGADDNEVQILKKDGTLEKIAKTPKKQLAAQLLLITSVI